MRAAAWIFVVIVPLRIVVDLLGRVDVPGPLTVPQIVHACIGVALAALVVARGRALATWPLLGPAVLLAVALVFGAARADSFFDAARYGLLLASPVLFLAAIHLWGDGRSAPDAWTFAAAIPVALSLAAFAAGQPAEHLVNGIPRLLGGYANPHTHGITLAVAAVAGVGLARRRPVAWLLVAGAAVCVVASFVRGAYLLAFLALVAGALLERRPMRAVGIAIGLGAVLALAGSLHDRWSDLGSLVSLTPPLEGWRALGSSRVHIWTGSVGAFLAGPPADVILGRGLGGHLGLHRSLDPHSDVLAVWFQVGPLGLVAYGWLVARAFAAILPSRTADGALAGGLLLGLVVAGTVSNDGLSRATAALWSAGLLGTALRSTHGPAYVATPTPPEARGRAATRSGSAG